MTVVSERPLRIGVLAVQGAFKLHQAHVLALGADYLEVARASDLALADGLILPGGESGAMLKLLDLVGLREALADYLKTKPGWGICAGAILMAKTVEAPEQWSYGALDIAVERNAYGRQRESCEASIDGYAVSYIRSPRITRVGGGVRVEAYRGRDPVWVESGRMMATTFHPEVNHASPSPWHRRFAAIVGANRSQPR